MNSVVLSPDGKYIVSVDITWDGNIAIKIWDFKTGECLNSLIEHSDCVNSIISPDGKYIVSVVNFEAIEILDIKTGNSLKYIDEYIEERNTWKCSISISPDGKYIVSGEESFDILKGIIKIWDFKTGECLKILKGHSGSVNSVTISPDGKYIVSGSRDSTIKIWDFETGENIYTIDNGCNISINNNGFFNVSDEDIDKYLRVSETLLTQRRLTIEEINHFRKKDDFLEIGEIIEKLKVEEIFVEKQEIKKKIQEIDVVMYENSF